MFREILQILERVIPLMCECPRHQSLLVTKNFSMFSDERGRRPAPLVQADARVKSLKKKLLKIGVESILLSKGDK